MNRLQPWTWVMMNRFEQSLYSFIVLEDGFLIMSLCLLNMKHDVLFPLMKTVVEKHH